MFCVILNKTFQFHFSTLLFPPQFHHVPADFANLGLAYNDAEMWEFSLESFCLQFPLELSKGHQGKLLLNVSIPANQSGKR
jgi:hypothetical protein